MLKCIIIEDELAAQKVLLHYVEQLTSLECLGVFGSGPEVPYALLKTADLMFLDMELPALNGLDFLRTLRDPPKVVMTTAYPNYAVEAFEQAVVDYLVKPFSYARFVQAVNRIHEQLQPAEESYLMVYADKTRHKIRLSEIIYLKSELDYVAIVTVHEKILVLDSLANWKKKLAPHKFLQVHRSYIINLERLRKIKANVVLVDDIEVPVGGSFREQLKRI